MRVLLFEVKKLFGWKRILLILLFCIFYYFFTINWNLHFVNTGGVLSEYETAVHMVEEFGVWMDDDDFAAFQKETAEAYRRFDELIQANTELQELRVTTFYRLFDYYWTELEWSDEIRHEEEVNLALELMARRMNIAFFESGQGMLIPSHNQTERQRERIEELENRKEQAVLDRHVFLGYQLMIGRVAEMVVLSLVMMISPVYLTERRNRMLSMQYTTKVGRRLFHKKVIASIMAASLIISIQLGVIFTLYSRVWSSIFFPADINSFLIIDHISWLDITFGQYILLTVGLVYLIGIIIAVLITFVSRLFPNYISVIGVQIPIIIIIFTRLLDSLIVNPTNIIFPPYLVPSLYTGLIFLVVVLIAVQWRREKKVDIKI